MKEVNYIVRKYLLNHEKNKKYLALLLALCLLVSFAVPYSLIQPADSMTIQNSPLADRLSNAEDESIPTYETQPTGAVEIAAENIDSLTTSPHPLTGGSAGSVSGDFILEFSFAAGSGVSSSQPYIYIKLPENITIPADYSGSTCKTYDYRDAWLKYNKYGKEADGVAGYYSIDQDSRLLVIKFTEDYLREMIDANDGAFAGSITFKGTVNRDATSNGDQVIQIGDEKITVAFDDQEATITKNSTQIATDGFPIIRWTVTITNPGRYTNLATHTLTDRMFADATVTTNPDGVGTLNGTVFTFYENANNYDSITFTYETQVTDELIKKYNGDFSNTATLHDTSNDTDGNVDTSKDKTASRDETVSTDDKATINKKEGTPSYKIDGSRDYVEWELSVSRNFGRSLQNYTIYDSAFKSDTDIVFTAVDGNGNDITSQIAIDKTTGIATINADVNSVTITYKAAPGDNIAKVTPPGGDTPDDSEERDNPYDDSSLFSVDKGDSGYWDESKQAIKWTVTISVDKNKSVDTLEGYIIEDTMFNSEFDGIFNVTNATKGWSGDNKSSEVSFAKNSDGTYTIHGDVDYVTFEYYTTLTQAQLAELLNGGKTFKNKISVTPGDASDDTKSDEGSVYLSERSNSVDKNLLSNSNVSVEGTYDGTITTVDPYELVWQVDLTKYDGFSGGDKSFVDVVSATGDGAHYISPDKADDIIVQAKTLTGDYVLLTPGTDYTITFYSDEAHTVPIENFASGTTNAKSYVITFKETVDEKNYIYATINYSTSADVNAVKNGGSSTFTNKASFDGKDGGGQYGPGFTFTRVDPNTTIPKIAVTLNKNWSGDTSLHRPPNIQVQLYRKEGETGEWKTYGNPVTVSSSSNSYQWTDLPQHTATEAETPYYYKVEEVSTNADYTTSYSSNNDAGITDSGTLTITNTWNYLNITANKSWVGDLAKYRPPTITLQLQKKKSGDDDWTKVEEVTVNNDGNGNFASQTWEKLARTDESGNAIYYRVVEIYDKETFAYVPTYSTEDGINSTGSVRITNTWKNMNVTAEKKWEKDKSENRPPTITLVLQQKIQNVDTEWQSTDKDPITLTKDDYGNYGTATWENLPRTDANGNAIYYRAVEQTVPTGYEASYDETGINNTSTVYVTNTSTYIDVTVQKKWYEDTASIRPTSIQVQLEQRLDGTTQWTPVEGKTPLTLTADESYTATWTNLPKKTADGTLIYYRATEVEGQDALKDYEASYTETGTNTTGTVTIENTWQKMNLTVNKYWNGDTEANRPDTIQIKLQQKTATGNWTDVDTTIAPVKEMTKESDFAALSWEGLPKKDSSGNVLYYRAVEVDGQEGLENYTASYSDNGINYSGSVSITNTYNLITISAEKVWSSAHDETADDRPKDHITFVLQQRTGTGWDDVEAIEIPNDGSGNFAPVTWEDLPKTDSSGNTIYYRVVENPVPTGYEASAFDEWGSNVNKTFTITNTKTPPYSKSPATVIANVDASNNGSKITDSFEVISSITPTDLETWTVKTVTIDGVATECYIFKWYVDITSGYSFKFYDKLPTGSVLYEEAGYGVMVSYGESKMEVSSWGNKTDTYVYPYTYDGYDNCIYFPLQNATNMDYFTYCTAVPKTIVDAEVGANGTYTLDNWIKGTDEETFRNYPLTIEKAAESTVASDLLKKGYLDKESNSNLAQAKYSLIVNPDGLMLSSDGMLDISDIFTITGYQEAGGERISGSDLIDALLSYVLVEEIDADGNVIRELSSNEYSYLVDTKDEVTIDETEYKFTTSDNKQYSAIGWEKGDVVEITLYGEAGTSLTDVWLFCVDTWGKQMYLYNDPSDNPTKLTFDSSGKATVTVTVPDDAAIFKVQHNDGGVTKVEAVVKESVTTTKTTLTFSVPDERRLKITYYYDLKTNAKTPSVLSGRSEIGVKPPVGDTIFMKNEAKLQTNSGSATDSTKETSIEVHEASSLVWVGEYPKIKKVNVGNYSISNISATFKLAKYEAGVWVYATEFENVYKKDKSGNDTTEIVSHTAVYADDSVETDGMVPENAANLVVDGTYTLSFEDDVLYKLIEIKAPDGYEDTGWVSAAETPLAEMKDFTFYFMYNGSLENLPDGVTASQVQSIAANGTVQIANNELIDIGATKTWSTVPSAASSVTLELWWSYVKSSTIPKSPVAEMVTAEALGLPETFSAEYELTSTTDPDTGEVTWSAAEIWTDLPNGKDGKPIYYYVKEVAYTIDGTTYRVDDDGNSSGGFKPTYSNNALNRDGLVSIMNSEGLIIRKQWRNSDNSTMHENLLPTDTIEFELYGITDGVKTENPIYTGTLTEEAGWQFKIPDNVPVGNYDSFTVEEINTGENLYNYTVTDVANVSGGAGVVLLVNRDNRSTVVNVAVEKVWGDGEELHTNDEITVKLYQSLEGNLLNSQILDISNGKIPDGVTLVDIEKVDAEITLSNSCKWTYTWVNLPARDDDGNTIYYYPVEVPVPEGYTVKTSKIDKSASQKMTITNYKPGTLSVNKSWVGQNNETYTGTLPESITVELYRRAKVAAATEEEDNTQIPTETVKIMSIGDSISAGYIQANTSNHGYRKYFYHQMVQHFEYSLDMVGENDGWDATWNFCESCGELWYDVGNTAHSGYSITSYNGVNGNRTGIFETIDADGSGSAKNVVAEKSPDIVLLRIGTNDILDTYDIANIQSRLTTLVNEIYSQKSDVQLLIMSPPPIDTSVVTWLPAQSTIDASITSYITAIKKVVEAQQTAGKACEYIDINTLFSKQTDYTTFLDDYCHPNEAGYELMGNYLATVVDRYIRTGKIEAETDSDTDSETNSAPDHIDYVPADLTEAEKVGEYPIIPNEGNWTLEIKDLEKTDEFGNQYVYYIKEKEVNGWSAGYTANGQFISDDTTSIITLTNTKVVRTLDLTVEKTWQDGTGVSRPESLTLHLKQSTDGENWADYSDAIPTLVMDGNKWTYSYDDLPGETNSGALYNYKVVEEVPSGYALTAETNNSVSLESENPVIALTNTKVMSLKVKKIWSDGLESHRGDTVTIEIHRAAAETDVPTQDIIEPDLEVETPADLELTVTVGHTGTVTVNKSGVDVTFEQSGIASAVVSDKTITVTGDAVGGPVVMHITDGKTTIDVNVTVTAEPTLNLTVNNAASATITAGNTATLAAVMSDGSSTEGLTYEVKSGADCISLSGSTVTGLNMGEAVIVAKLGDKTSNEVKVTVNLSSDGFMLSKSADEVEIDQSIKLTPSPSYGTFTYSAASSDGGAVEITTNADGTASVKGKTAGTVSITATRNDGKTATVDVKVVESIDLVIYKDGVDVTGDTIEIGIGQSVVFTTNKDISSISNSNNYHITSSVTGTREITVNAVFTTPGWNVPITVTDASGNTAKLIIVGIEATATTAATTTTQETTTTTTTTATTAGGESQETTEATTTTTTSGGASGTLATVAAGGTYNFTNIDSTKTVTKIELTLGSDTSSGAGADLRFYDESSKEIGYGGWLTYSNGTVSSAYGSTTANGNVVTYSPANAITVSKLSLIANNSGSWVINTIVITYSDGTVVTYPTPQAQVLSLRSMSASASKLSRATTDSTYVTTVTLDASNSNAVDAWETLAENLPAYDESGNAYYYWIVETAVEGSTVMGAYDQSYSFSDGDDQGIDVDNCINAAAPGDDPTATVKNTKLDETSTMPSTGGRGTTWNYGIGMVMILGSAAGYLMFRRRQKDESK